MKAIRVHHHGGPEVLQLDEIPTPEPGSGEIRVDIAAAGVNYVDTYHRRGAYSVELPFTPGSEAAGIVDAVGPGVEDIAPGDRVAYAMSLGTYAEYAIVAADRTALLPDETTLESAAAALLQGMTAHYLTHSTYAIQEGDDVLVHAAAGGTGLLIVQMAKKRGARVIGTTSSAEKAQLAKENGADDVIRYDEVEFDPEVRRLTGGKGVHVVYDGVGQATFDGDLRCLRKRGLLALFGAASGPVPPFDPQQLLPHGSLFLTRPTLGDYSADREELLWRAGDVLSWMGTGELNVRIDRTFPLAEAAGAHRYIEGRRTKGKLLLIP